jgi:hypothetical protein
MNGKWLGLCIIIGALVYGGVDFAGQYPQLPPQVASHFNFAGQPDGWSSKAEFIGMSVAVLALVVFMSGLMSAVACDAPVGLINLPNKGYWFAPERETETRRSIVRWGLWFTAATLWLVVLVIHEAMAANLRQPPQLQSVWWLLAGYGTGVVLLLIQLVTRFMRTENNRN